MSQGCLQLLSKRWGSVAARVLRTPDCCSGGRALGSRVAACYFRSTAPTATGWGGVGGCHPHSPLVTLARQLCTSCSCWHPGQRSRLVSPPKMADGKRMQGVGGMAEPPLPSLYRTARLQVLCPWTTFPSGTEPHPRCHCPRVMFRAVRNLLPGPQLCPDGVGVRSPSTSQPTSEEQKQNRGFPVPDRSPWCGRQPAGPGATSPGLPRVTQPARCHQGLGTGRTFGVSQAHGTLSISPALGSRVGSAGRAGDRVGDRAGAGDGDRDRDGIRP